MMYLTNKNNILLCIKYWNYIFGTLLIVKHVFSIDHFNFKFATRQCNKLKLSIQNKYILQYTFKDSRKTKIITKNFKITII